MSTLMQNQPMVTKEELRLGFSKRLNEACDKAGVRVRGRAVDIQKLLKSKKIPVTTTAIGKWLNGEAVPEQDKLLPLALWLEVRPSWLEYGEGNRLNEAQSTYATNTSKGPKLKDKVPLISWVQAGSWTEVANAYELGAAETYYYCPVPHGPNTFALQVRGESMENPHSRRSFYDGDIIFIDPDKGADHNSLVVVKLDDSNEATFKQLIIEGNEHYLKALNPTWPEPVIRINGGATICGVVIARLDVF